MELVAGNFERVLVSPMGPMWGVVAIAAFPVGYATLFASAMLGISAAVFGISLHVAGLVPAFCVAVLGALALASIGLLFVASPARLQVGDGGDVGDRGAEPARRARISRCGCSRAGFAGHRMCSRSRRRWICCVT